MTRNGQDPLPPLPTATDQETLIQAVAAENVTVDLIDTKLHKGWQNAVLETRDGWILRFPLTESHDFGRELRLLEVLRDRLPVDIPLVRWTGKNSRFAAYRTLTGVQLDSGTYLNANREQRKSLASSMANFLVRMHKSLTNHEAAALGVAHLRSIHLIDEVDQRWELIPPKLQPDVSRLKERFQKRWVEPADGDAVLLHNDFHLGNMVFTLNPSELKAIWDFSCVELGDPSYDFRYLFEDCLPLAVQTADKYEQLTGLQIDLPGALLAGHFEAVSDALIEGTDLRLVFLKWSQIS